MTTRADLLKTVSEIKTDIKENTKTLSWEAAHFIRRYLKQKKNKQSLRPLKVELKAALDRKRWRRAEVAKLQQRKKNILKALSIWLDAGDVIGKYETKKEEKYE